MPGFLSCITSTGKGQDLLNKNKEYVTRTQLEPNCLLLEFIQVWIHMMTWQDSRSLLGKMEKEALWEEINKTKKMSTT